MSNKIGRFEILSEITHSDLGSVYKVNDPESGQTVVLKTLGLQPFGDQSAAVVQSLAQEAESAKPLNSPNIAQVYGTAEIDGQLCAWMEYVQGNSIGTMLARREGFSIWDLQDIARQTCQGLDHARVYNAVHWSLEPAKIMVSWDGTVKILDYGISSLGTYACQIEGKTPEILHYMSPEQVRGEALDSRSNLFSLGVILYEMVTELKPFLGNDAEEVRKQILEGTPPAPDQINRKINLPLSRLIMKAIRKAPDQRYQSGHELLYDLENCNDTRANTVAKKTGPAGTPRNAPGDTSAARVRSAAAAAGWEGPSSSVASTRAERTEAASPSTAFHADAYVQGLKEPGPGLSAAAERETEIVLRSLPVDPMMSESTPAGIGKGLSFSDVSELPPLKEAYAAPEPPSAVEESPISQPRAASPKAVAPQKPKVQPHQVAKKAVTEIRKTPPKLFGYSIATAVGVILLVIAGIAAHIYLQNSESSSSRFGPTVPAAQSQPSQPALSTKVPANQAETAATTAPEEISAQPSVAPAAPRYRSKRKQKAPMPIVPAVIPGQLTINSAPEGATIRLDGRTDPSWITPLNIPGLAPGQHTVSIAKAGYSQETRTIEVASNSKSFLVVQLALAGVIASLNSDPAGAAVFIDGKNTGRVTPVQISVDKPGMHTLLLKKQGYLEESTMANLQAGQSFRFAPALKPLGTTDDIKIGGGKFKRIFGGGDTAGMGTVNVKTQPKGAQVAVNNRILDKSSPLQFYLNPGNYVIDIAMSGYKDIHRVISVEKGGKLTLDETMERE
jgi:serine/threonine protein kinase